MKAYWSALAGEPESAKLTVPLHPELAEVLAAWPRSHLRLLTTRRLGNPSRRRDSEIGWPTKLANLRTQPLHHPWSAEGCRAALGRGGLFCQ